MRNTNQDQPSTANKQPPQRLVFGVVIGWVLVILAVIVCIVVGVRWSNQRASNAQLNPQTEIPSPGTEGVSLPTALPTQSASGINTTNSTSGAPTFIPNQDQSFGYGIEVRLASDRNTALKQVTDLGMGWVKYHVRWADIESQPGNYQWDVLDSAIGAASRSGVKVLITVDGSPDWARTVAVEHKDGPPDRADTFVNFITQLVQRYRGAIHAIEIWEQENTDAYWYTAGGLSPSGYLTLLVATSQAVRQIDPGIMIISGSLTPTGRNDGIAAIDDFIYMRQLIDAGLLDYVDCVGVRHSGFNLPPDISAEDAFAGGKPFGIYFAGPFDTANPVNPHHSWAFYSTLNGYYNMIVAAQREIPLCVTSFGWASNEGMSGSVADGYEFARDNSLEDQAAYIVQAFKLMRSWGFVRMAVLFNLDFAIGSSSGQLDPDAYYSLLRINGLARPSYNSVVNLPKTP